jgi:hypothetical protein
MKAKGHAVVRMLFKVSPNLIPVFRAGQIVRFRPVLPDTLRVCHLVGQQLDHDRVIQTVCDAAVGNAEEVLFTPFIGRLRIAKEAGRVHGTEP